MVYLVKKTVIYLRAKYWQVIRTGFVKNWTQIVILLIAVSFPAINQVEN